MKRISGLRQVAWIVILAAAFAVQGCSNPIVKYAYYRYEDFGEVLDGGFTITTTPQWGFYWNSLEIFPFGYSDIDGYFLGWGGGQIGLTRHYNHCWGLGYGEETIGWGWGLDDPAQRESMLIKRRSGIIGIATAAMGIDFTGNGHDAGPNYTPACVHFFPHVGYVGLVWNLRYTEIIDFMLGWTTLDISGDDGYAVGRWSFPRRRSDDGPTELAPPPIASDLHDERGAWTPTSDLPAEEQVWTPEPAMLGSEPPASAAPVPSTAGQLRYVAASGDTLMSIAHVQLGDIHKWKAIAELNGLVAPYTIEPGQDLLLPAAGGRRTYTVREGDGLIKIAREQLGDVRKWKAIAALNSLGPPYIIQIGQQLLLPQ